MITFTYEGEGARLSKAAQKYPEITYNQLKKLLREKDVKVNGKRVNDDVLLCSGDVVVIYNKNVEVECAYEDDNLFVAVKPKGVASEGEGSMETRVARLHPEYRLCHRLDTNTDGLLIFAKTEQAYAWLLEGFKQKAVEKYYLARVYGRVEGAATLHGYLTKDAERGVVSVSSKPQRGAVEIITEYRTLENYPDSTLLEVSPITGKTHQIRAHLASIGHFVLGDGKYGRDDVNRRLGVKKTLLTAYKLKFNFAEGSPLFYLNSRQICLKNPELL